MEKELTQKQKDEIITMVGIAISSLLVGCLIALMLNQMGAFYW